MLIDVVDPFTAYIVRNHRERDSRDLNPEVKTDLREEIDNQSQKPHLGKRIYRLKPLHDLNFLLKRKVGKTQSTLGLGLKQILHRHVCKIKSFVFQLLPQIELFRKLLPLLS